MNTFYKSLFTLLVASSLTTVALASSGGNNYGRIIRAQQQVKLLEKQVEDMGGSVEVNRHSMISTSDELLMLNQKAADLQEQIDRLRDQGLE
ncbi:MAG: hypothetical protein ACTIMT_16120 [Marinomonadaceae bacterium]